MTDSATYDRLAQIASKFITDCMPDPPGSNTPNTERMLASYAPDFRICWGHKTFVDSFPPLQGDKSRQEFVEHIASMAKQLSTWRPEITNTIVDVRKRSVVLRADFHMTAQNQTTVLNDIIFIVDIDESLDRLSRVTEFIDPKAHEHLREAMKV